MLADLRNRFIVFSALAIGAVTGANAEEIEGPSFEVLTAAQVDGGEIEVREYAPLIEARTTVEAENARAASNKAFMTVAGYIFGGNTGGDKIAMTAPVRTSGTKIAMTAPVRTTGETQLDEAGAYTVAFMMPRKWTMKTLPKPKDDRVTLHEVPSETLATLRFVGEPSAEEAAAREAELRTWLEANGWTVTGASGISGYDGPSVPAAKRRYEVTFPVEKRA